MRRRPKRAHAKVEARRLAEALQREAELLDTIATNAVRVCGAYDATVLLREGEFVRGAAHHGPLTSGREDLDPNRVIRDADPVHLRFEEFRQVGTAAKKVEGRGVGAPRGRGSPETFRATSAIIGRVARLAGAFCPEPTGDDRMQTPTHAHFLRRHLLCTPGRHGTILR